MSSAAVQRFALPVRHVHRATPRTRIITVDLGSHEFVFSAGQAVRVGLADSTVRRPYSIACSPTQARQTRAIELLVQIDDHAAPDPHLERARPGTKLAVEGPFGSFGIPHPLPERHLLFVAGGTGIAPLRSMMWETLTRDADIRIGMIYSARSPEEFAYTDELSELAARARIALRLTITRDASPDWTGGRGRIDATLLRSMLVSSDTRVVVCGPQALVSDAAATLRMAGVDGERIVSETFAG